MTQDKSSSRHKREKSADPQNTSRRRAVKTIAGSVGALAAYHVLPVNWSRPIVEQVFLPANAAVSGITLSDPCTVDLVSGDQSSSIDVIRVSGFVTPPVGGLETTIEATPNGGSGGPVTVTTATASDGTYSAEVTMVGGPGIVGVGVTTTVAGVGGAVHCSVGVPPAGHPSAQPSNPPAPGSISADCTGGPFVPPGLLVVVTFTLSPAQAGETVSIEVVEDPPFSPNNTTTVTRVTDSSGQVTYDLQVPGTAVDGTQYLVTGSYLGSAAPCLYFVSAS